MSEFGKQFTADTDLKRANYCTEISDIS